MIYSSNDEQRLVMPMFVFGACCFIFLVIGLVLLMRGRRSGGLRHIFLSSACLTNFILVYKGYMDLSSSKLFPATTIPFLVALLWQGLEQILAKRKAL